MKTKKKKKVAKKAASTKRRPMKFGAHLRAYIRRKLRANGFTGAVTADHPFVQVAMAYGHHLVDTGEVATMEQITTATGISNPEILGHGTFIWNQYVTDFCQSRGIKHAAVVEEVAS